MRTRRRHCLVGCAYVVVGKLFTWKKRDVEVSVEGCEKRNRKKITWETCRFLFCLFFFCEITNFHGGDVRLEE
jgi:hypothetical protein